MIEAKIFQLLVTEISQRDNYCGSVCNIILGIYTFFRNDGAFVLIMCKISNAVLPAKISLALQNLGASSINMTNIGHVVDADDF